MAAPVDDQFTGSVFALSQAFLCMQTYGTPLYARVNAEIRDDFERYLAAGELIYQIESLKHDAGVEALEAGISLSDRVLVENCISDVRPGVPLPAAVQNRLGQLVDELHVVVRRLGQAREVASREELAREMEANRRLGGKVAALMSERRKIQLPPAEPKPLELPPSPTAPADGPEGDCWIRWDGERHTVPRGTVFRLIAYMWTREAARYDDLMGKVFEGEVDTQTVRSLASKTNKRLGRIGVPWRLACNATDRVLSKSSARIPKNP